MKALVRLPFQPHPPVPHPFSGSMKSQPWTTREVPPLFIKRHKLLTVRMEQVQHCKVCRCQNDNKGRLWTAMGFPSGSAVKSLPAVQELWVWPLDQEDPLEDGTQPTSVFLTGESHGQRSLVDYSP